MNLNLEANKKGTYKVSIKNLKCEPYMGLYLSSSQSQ
jgi:hypothetical protein